MEWNKLGNELLKKVGFEIVQKILGILEDVVSNLAKFWRAY